MNEDETLQDVFDKAVVERLEKAIEEGNEEEVLEKIAASVPATAQEIGDGLLQKILSSAKGDLLPVRRETLGFVRRNFLKWGSGLDLLESHIQVCTESGSSFNERYRPIAVDNDDLVFEVLVRLHARGCQIARECAYLLVGGYADGAHARWRALHEVACTACFVQQHGNETAERFLRHEVVESHKARLQFNQYSGRNKLTPFSEEEVRKGKELYDEIVSVYGKSFKESYGWAAEALGITNPNFSQIEQNVKLDHMRPYYKWASLNVHASSKGIGRRLGVHSSSADVLLVGPSDSGLTDPADAVGLSLLVITTTLLTIEPSLDDLVALHVASGLQTEIGPTFMRVDPYRKGE